jgi:hypothetical protein
MSEQGTEFILMKDSMKRSPDVALTITSIAASKSTTSLTRGLIVWSVECCEEINDGDGGDDDLNGLADEES